MKNTVKKHRKERVSPLVEIIEEYRGGSEENCMACLKAVRSALANGADANMPHRGMNFTPLMVAAERWGFGEVLRTLLAHGADANEGDVNRRTALDNAICSEDADNVRILLEGGANVNQPGVLNRVVSWRENREILRVMIEHGADVNMRDEKGDSPLHGAVRRCRYEDMCLLLKAGADPNARNKRGDSPMSLAQSRNDTEALALLTATREDIEQMEVIKTPISLRSIMLKHNHYGDPIGNELNMGNPNHEACLAELQEALAAGAEVDSKGSSDLGLAIRLGYRMDIIKLLMDAGADVNTESWYEYRPLAWLMRYDYFLYHYKRDVKEVEDIAQLLIDAGADIKAYPENGLDFRPFLHHACLYFSAKLVRMLLEAGAEVCESDSENNERQAIHYAALANNHTAVYYLLKYGAETDVQDEEGNTPLHLAAKYGKLKAVRILLKAGASIHLTNADGQTALDLATAAKCKRIADLLVKHVK